MKCYRMHEDLRITSMLDGSHPIADAMTIYRGFAVCQEHLEEMQSLPSIATDFGWGELIDPNYYPKFEEVSDA